MRPMYESTLDQLQEAFIAGEFGCWLNRDAQRFELHKVPMGEPGQHVPDFRIVRLADKKVVGYIEVKDRSKYSFSQITELGGLMLSAQKHAMLNTLATSGYSTAFVVAFSDGIGYYNIAQADTRLGIGGRVDRGDPHDRETVVYFDPSQFHWIQES